MHAPCRIVVGIDGTRHSRDAIGLAQAILGSREGSLIVAYVYPHSVLPEAAYSAVGSASPRKAAERYVQRSIERVRASASACVIEDSSPAHALHELARETAADMIVVGSSHRGVVGRVLLGDGGAQTVHGSPCPVALAPSGWRTARELAVIGVAYDGSPESRQAVACAEPIARESSAMIRLVHVIEPPAAALTAKPPLTDWPTYHAARIRDARDVVDPMLSLLGARGDTEIRLGDTVDELEAACEHLDLLIVGSRGQGPLRRVLAGSTAMGLLRAATCPIIVVPRADPAEHREAGDAVSSPISPRSLT